MRTIYQGRQDKGTDSHFIEKKKRGQKILLRGVSSIVRTEIQASLTPNPLCHLCLRSTVATYERFSKLLEMIPLFNYCCVTKHLQKTQWLKTTTLYYFSWFCGSTDSVRSFFSSMWCSQSLMCSTFAGNSSGAGMPNMAPHSQGLLFMWPLIVQ